MDDDQIVYYNAADVIETASGNKISRKSVLCGGEHIVLKGKSIIMNDVVTRGDLATVSVGRHCVVNQGSVVRPAPREWKGGLAFLKLAVGDYVWVGKNCVLQSVMVGSHVFIGDDVIVSPRCMIYGCSKICDGAVLAPDTVVPPFTVFAGSPARQVAELPDSFAETHKRAIVAFFDRFRQHKG